MELGILNLIQTIHTPFLDKLMVFITSLGNSGMAWISGYKVDRKEKEKWQS